LLWRKSEGEHSGKIDKGKSCSTITDGFLKPRAGLRGGIDIIEVLPGRGAPEGGTVMQVRNLSEAEDSYLSLKNRLDKFTK
jgi:hypothetical protein